jgi:hypothetical protein
VSFTIRPFNSGERARRSGWVPPVGGLDCPCRGLKTDRSARSLSLYRLSYLESNNNNNKSLSVLLNILIYKAILKPIWTYGIQPGGTTSNSSIEILERFQSRVFRLIVNAPWCVSNSVIRKDLQIPTVKEEISHFSSLYSVRLRAHTTMNLLPHSPSRQSTSVCADIGPTTCLPDSSLFLYL